MLQLHICTQELGVEGAYLQLRCWGLHSGLLQGSPHWSMFGLLRSRLSPSNSRKVLLLDWWDDVTAQCDSIPRDQYNYSPKDIDYRNGAWWLRQAWATSICSGVSVESPTTTCWEGVWNYNYSRSDLRGTPLPSTATTSEQPQSQNYFIGLALWLKGKVAGTMTRNTKISWNPPILKPSKNIPPRVYIWGASALPRFASKKPTLSAS